MRVPAVMLLAAAAFTAFAAEITGTVISAAGRSPLKRAEVVLRNLESGLPAVGVTTDDRGAFAFFDLTPGKYRLETSRAGFLTTDAVYASESRAPSPLIVDKDLANLTVRLLPAGTIAGTVRHGDGEAAQRISVEAYRDIWYRNRHAIVRAGAATTDDDGRYRIPGLPAGRYYIAALYVPFSGADDVEEGLVRDSNGLKAPPERTVTTFLPSAVKLGESTAVTVKGGAEIEQADIFLARSRASRIVGRALHGDTGRPAEGATVSLLREDASGSGYLRIGDIAVYQRGPGEFQIRGVPPGSYILESRGASDNKSLFTRQPIVVGNAPEVSASLLLQSDATVTGHAVSATRNERVGPGLRVIAEPRSEGAATRIGAVDSRGDFTLQLTAGERYDLLLVGAPRNAFLSEARIDSADVMSSGLALEAPSKATLTITVDPKGGEVRGYAQPGAIVSLMPAAANAPLARFHEMAASEWGFFHFSGVAPGEYRAIAWFDEPPCELWNPAERGECMRFGRSVRVQESGSHIVSLEK